MVGVHPEKCGTHHSQPGSPGHEINEEYKSHSVWQKLGCGLTNWRVLFTWPVCQSIGKLQNSRNFMFWEEEEKKTQHTVDNDAFQ